jgi:tRNA U34 2-thiouridine synthase MnmA/TrmU
VILAETKKTRVVVGMSGGVDSSAAAALLQEQGYDVVGITLKLWPQDCVNRAEDKCCGPQAVMDARSVSHKLNIPYYLIDEADDFKKQVIHYFAEEYKAGRTPNPCVMCNEKLKFGALISRARQLGADYIATGHFARVEKTDEGRMLLKRGRDSKKGPELFSLFAQAGPTGAHAFPPRRNDQERHPLRGAAEPAQDGGQGGEHGNLLRAGRGLRQIFGAIASGGKTSRGNCGCSRPRAGAS